MEKKMTAKELAKIVMDDNYPIDWKWLRYNFKKDGAKAIFLIAKQTCEEWAPHNASKQLIGRAARIVYKELIEELKN